MALEITDGKGRGYVAAVTADQKLLTNAETNVTGHFVSLRDGLLFNTVSIDPDAAANDYICYFKNTSTTRLFFVDLIRVGAVNAVRWKVAEVSGTSTGTALTPVNMNLTSGVTAEATARGNAAVGGLTEVSVLATARSVGASHVDIPFDDTLILGTNDAIAVEYDTGTTGIAEVLIRGYYAKSTDRE